MHFQGFHVQKISGGHAPRPPRCSGPFGPSEHVAVDHVFHCSGDNLHATAASKLHDSPEHVLCSIVSEVKMPGSCYPKTKAIQSRVRKQNNCPSFGNKSRSSR